MLADHVRHRVVIAQRVEPHPGLAEAAAAGRDGRVAVERLVLVPEEREQEAGLVAMGERAGAHLARRRTPDKPVVDPFAGRERAELCGPVAVRAAVLAPDGRHHGARQRAGGRDRAKLDADRLTRLDRPGADGELERAMPPGPARRARGVGRLVPEVHGPSRPLPARPVPAAARRAPAQTPNKRQPIAAAAKQLRDIASRQRAAPAWDVLLNVEGNA
jgi:hypothetical protein